MLENILNKLRKNKKIVIDLNELLTKDNYKLKNIKPVSLDLEEKLIEIAAYAESNSDTDIAKIITSIYGKVNKNFAGEVEEVPGKGIKAKYNLKNVYAGNRKLLFDNDIKFEQVTDDGIIVYIAEDEKYLGYIHLDIELNCKLEEEMYYLKDKNYDLILVSGHKKDVVEKVANTLGITEFYYGLDGNMKEEKIRELEEKYNAIRYNPNMSL